MVSGWEALQAGWVNWDGGGRAERRKGEGEGGGVTDSSERELSGASTRKRHSVLNPKVGWLCITYLGTMLSV